MDLWVVNDTIRRSKMRDVPGASAVRGARIWERFGLSGGAGRVSDLPEYQTGDHRYVACLPDLDEQGKQSLENTYGKKRNGPSHGK